MEPHHLTFFEYSQQIIYFPGGWAVDNRLFLVAPHNTDGEF